MFHVISSVMLDKVESIQAIKRFFFFLITALLKETPANHCIFILYFDLFVINYQQQLTVKLLNFLDMSCASDTASPDF